MDKMLTGPAQPVSIQDERLMELLTRLGSIGQAADGSITRLAFSPEYHEIAVSLCAEARKIGLRAECDPLSNVMICFPGRDPTAKTIYLGSHLDTVPQGGLYDGLLGVAAGFECLHTWREHQLFLRHPVCLIGFNAEEGGALGGTFGSRAILGQVKLSDPSVRSLLNGHGVCTDHLSVPQLVLEKAQCYLELHIEQGARLDRENIPIGIVTGIVGISRLLVTCQGERNHAGSTPMDCRKDALVGMAQLILKVSELAGSFNGSLVATTGHIEVQPNMPNVIPGTVTSLIDIRALRLDTVNQFIAMLEQAAENIQDVSFTFKVTVAKEGTISDPLIQKTIQNVCQRRDIPYRFFASGAGHDANAFGKCMPTGMIFVPSVGGKSHCKEEFTHDSDIRVGAQILCDTLLELDQIL